jgi:hypothetical protein
MNSLSGSTRPALSLRFPVKTVGVDHEDRPKPDLFQTVHPQVAPAMATLYTDLS